MQTARESPPTATDTLLGWKSIFTTSEALEMALECYSSHKEMYREG